MGLQIFNVLVLIPSTQTVLIFAHTLTCLYPYRQKTNWLLSIYQSIPYRTLVLIVWAIFFDFCSSVYVLQRLMWCWSQKYLLHLWYTFKSCWILSFPANGYSLTESMFIHTNSCSQICRVKYTQGTNSLLYITTSKIITKETHIEAAWVLLLIIPGTFIFCH